MGPRRQRIEAVSKLKDALTRQFGEHARSHVDIHVDAHLGSSKGQISREHLDAIEKSIMSSMRQTRGSTKSGRLSLSQSAPSLPPPTSTVGSTKAATTGVPAPSTPARPMPKVPIGTSNPGASV